MLAFNESGAIPVVDPSSADGVFTLTWLVIGLPLIGAVILLLGGAPARTIGEWRIDLPRPREDFVAELGRIRIEIVGTLRRATRPH